MDTQQFISIMKKYQAASRQLSEMKDQLMREFMAGLSGDITLSLDKLNDLIEVFLAAGLKIDAIKIYRNTTGSTLKEAKEYVDNIESKLAAETIRKKLNEVPYFPNLFISEVVNKK